MDCSKMNTMPGQTRVFPLMIVNAPPKAGVITVTTPFDGAFIAEVETGDQRHVEKALQTACALFKNRAQWLPLHERIGILERAARIMLKEHNALSLEATREGGKPLIDSQIEVTRAIDGLHLCIEALKSEPGHVIPMGTSEASTHRTAFTLKQPIGVVVAVSAFNHPLNLIVHQVATAVAAGCPVIVKPAEDTPLSCLRFVDILHRAGLPEGWCQSLVVQNIAIATQLVTDQRVGFFSFTGSAKVGWMLRSKLAPGVRCALEHGGAAPVIVADDADDDLALRAILRGGYYHAGQVCVSVQRVFVPQAKAYMFAKELANRASRLRVGDPTKIDTEVGPLIRHSEVLRVHEWVDEAVAAGASCLAGGQPLSASCYPCTVLLDPPHSAKVSCLEIFGPIICIYGYDRIDAAITEANSLPVAFQSAVFTKSIDTALQFYKQFDASVVMVNDHTAFRIDSMPFAGLRQSGLGVGGIPHTIADMQIEKMLVINSPEL